MPTTFYGKWSLKVTGNVGEFMQRYRVVGSIASDGVVDGAIGTQVAGIDGTAWNLFSERSADGGATWQENIVQRLPGVTAKNGLIVTLYGDDDIVSPADSDCSVEFIYLNPVVNPPGPPQPPFGFTLPPGSFWPPRPCIKDPCASHCPPPCRCLSAKPHVKRCCG